MHADERSAEREERARVVGSRAGELLLALLAVALPFAAAGTVRWPAGWAFAAVLTVSLALQARYVAGRNPGLQRHRARIGEGTPVWDKVWVPLFWLGMLAVPIAGALDTVRWAHAPMPSALWFSGLALLGGGLAVSATARAVNPFFEGTARLQPERGQQVVDAGPYRVVRHPGYLGLALWALGAAFLVRSWAALAVGAAVALWIGVRTALEDRLLRRGLPGYAEYAARVRSRLIPGDLVGACRAPRC